MPPTALFSWTPPLSPVSKSVSGSKNHFPEPVVSGSPNFFRFLQAADRAQARVLAHQPAVFRFVFFGRAGVGRKGEVEQLAEDVGDRLVEGARLVVVEEVRLRGVDAVRELMAGDVVGDEAVAVDHLFAVPEGVFERAFSGFAEADGRDQRQPVVVDAVAAEVAHVEVVEVASEVVGGIGVGFRGHRRAFRQALFQFGFRFGAGHQFGFFFGVADDPVFSGTLDLAEVEGDVAEVGVDEHQIADRDRADSGADLDPPDGARHREAGAAEDPRVVDRELGVRRGQLGGGDAGALGDRGDRRLGSGGGADRRGRVDHPVGLELAGDREQVPGPVEADREFSAENGDAVDGLLEVGGRAPVAVRFEPADPQRPAGPEAEVGPKSLAGLERGRARRRGPQRDRPARAGADEGDAGAGLRLGRDSRPGAEPPGQRRGGFIRLCGSRDGRRERRREGQDRDRDRAGWHPSGLHSINT